MKSRTLISLDPETHRGARKRAAQLGISFAEYVRRLVARDLGGARPTTNPSAVFNLGRSEGSDIARDKDRILGEAVGAERKRRRTSGG